VLPQRIHTLQLFPTIFAHHTIWVLLLLALLRVAADLALACVFSLDWLSARAATAGPASCALTVTVVPVASFVGMRLVPVCSPSTCASASVTAMAGSAAAAHTLVTMVVAGAASHCIAMPDRCR
jgi:hypothetical protein